MLVNKTDNIKWFNKHNPADILLVLHILVHEQCAKKSEIKDEKEYVEREIGWELNQIFLRWCDYWAELQVIQARIINNFLQSRNAINLNDEKIFLITSHSVNLRVNINWVYLLLAQCYAGA